MNFWKGLAVSLLSFLLFLSLALFGMAYTLKSTLLNPDFVVTQVDRIEVSSLTKEITDEYIKSQLPPEAEFLEEPIYSFIDKNEPWLKEQVKAGIHSFYDFMLGESERLSLVISLGPLKENLREELWLSMQQNVPVEFTGLPEAAIEQYFNEVYGIFAEQIPSSVELDESLIPADVMTQLIKARQYIGYFQLGYNLLIGFMVLLVLGIILINRDVKNTTRGLGVPLLTYGVIEYAGIWASKYFAPSLIPQQWVPPQLQAWLLQLTDDVLAPLEMFSIGMMVGGAALIIVSFVYRRRREEEEV
jgi:hypothetical protein